MLLLKMFKRSLEINHVLRKQTTKLKMKKTLLPTSKQANFEASHMIPCCKTNNNLSMMMAHIL